MHMSISLESEHNPACSMLSGMLISAKFSAICTYF